MEQAVLCLSIACLGLVLILCHVAASHYGATKEFVYELEKERRENISLKAQAEVWRSRYFQMLYGKKVKVDDKVIDADELDEGDED